MNFTPLGDSNLDFISRQAQNWFAVPAGSRKSLPQDSDKYESYFSTCAARQSTMWRHLLDKFMIYKMPTT